jgi:methyl-accepting chemotaxis protein
VRGRQWTTRSPVAALIVMLLLAAGFIGLRGIAAGAFDRLEEIRVAEDAARIRIALDYEVQLLRNYGATNSIWDDSYTSVAMTDQEGMLAAFPPGDLQDLYGLDGVIGVGPDGSFRVGGLAADGDAYTPLAPDLADPQVLRRLFDPDAEPGTGTCGMARVSTGPLVYCGFASYRSDSSGPAAGGLVYLITLTESRLEVLGQRMDLPIRLVDRPRPGATGHGGVAGSLGELRVATSTISSDHIALSVTVPTVTGGDVVLEAVRDRPIHRAATSTVLKMFLLTAGAGVLLVVAVMVLVSRGIKRQVGPLRRTAEAVIASGERGLRVRSTAAGEIGALGRAIDTMLDALAARDAELEKASARREQQRRATDARRRLAERQERRRTQSLVDETIDTVVAQLSTVVDKTGTVRGATDSIDDRVESASAITRTVVGRADHADRAVDEMGGSLRRVGGILRLISEVAAQTKLLALNATIEAARAGAAGKGFNVVAGEVKNLAATTARSTDEITTTIRSVERGAAAMAAVIAEMSAGIGDIQTATAQVSTVTREQNECVDELNATVQAAISRIRTMTNLSDQLERRAHPRAPVSGTARVRRVGGLRGPQGEAPRAGHAGREDPARVLDLSEGGVRLAVEPEVPLAANDVVEIELTLDGGGDPLACRAQVVHVVRDADSDVEVGLRLLDPPAELTRRLRAVVAEVLAGG